MVVLDFMHCVDEGITTYILATIWWTILPHLTRVASRSQQHVRQCGLKRLKTRLSKWYSERRTDTRVPVRKLTLKKIKMRSLSEFILSDHILIHLLLLNL